MTIETQQVRIVYTGDGSSTHFAVPFPFLEPEHLLVYQGTGELGTTDILLRQGADYKVSGSGAAGGTVVLTAPLAAAAKLAVLRFVPYTQLVDYPEGGSFPAQTHEGALDKLTMQVQQLQDLFTRTPYGPPTSGASGTIIIEEMTRWYEATQVNAASAAVDADRAETAATRADDSAVRARADADRAAALADTTSLASSVYNVRKAFVLEADIAAGGTLVLPGRYYPTRDVLFLSYAGTVCTPRVVGVEASGAYQYAEIGSDPNAISDRVTLFFDARAGEVFDMWVVASAAGNNVAELEVLVDEAAECRRLAGESAAAACDEADKAAAAALNLPDVGTAHDGQTLVARNVGGRMQAGYENPPSASVARVCTVLGTPLAAGTHHTVPAYIVGSGKLQVFMDGAYCEPGLVYQESGATGLSSTGITFSETLSAGTQLTAITAA